MFYILPVSVLWLSFPISTFTFHLFLCLTVFHFLIYMYIYFFCFYQIPVFVYREMSMSKYLLTGFGWLITVSESKFRKEWVLWKLAQVGTIFFGFQYIYVCMFFFLCVCFSKGHLLAYYSFKSCSNFLPRVPFLNLINLRWYETSLSF